MNETQNRIKAITDEMTIVHKERVDVIRGIWTSLLARQHLLMVGPPGTGKSFLVRDVASRILNDNDKPLWDEAATVPVFNGYFEKALDETTTPDEVVGATDVKGIVEEGKMRRVTTGMLPEAHIAFIDEFFNGNGPTLHSIMPILNERLFHNNGIPTRVPLWSAFMGTNKLNADIDQAALWDRVHQRFPVKYVQDRANIQDLAVASLERKLLAYIPADLATVSLAELRAAHDEAMQLPVPDVTWEMLFDIHDALLMEGIEIGTRRVVEGIATVKADAYLEGNDEVKLGNLAALQNVWWLLQDQRDTARSLILQATNPGEKAALAMLDDLDKLRSQVRDALDLDTMKRDASGLEVYKSCQRLLEEAKSQREKASAASSSTARLDEVIERTNQLMAQVSKEVFGLDAETTKNLRNAGS